MLSSHISRFSVRPGSAVVLRYGTAIILVAFALGIALFLRHENDRLKLLLDLNNSIVSKLDLRDLLRDISASLRRLMQCDAVGITLPDQETDELKLFALDFPGAKGFLREEMPRTSGSLANKA